MCLRSCAAILLLSCCWPWLASADGSGGQPPATWAQLDATWISLGAESRELLTQLTEQSLLIDQLSEDLWTSKQASLGLKSEIETLKERLQQQSEQLTDSGAALTEAQLELGESQDSLRLVDKSLQASARSAFVRSLLIGAGALGAGLLIGILAN